MHCIREGIVAAKWAPHLSGAAKRLFISNRDALSSVRIGAPFGVRLFLAGGAQHPLLVPQLPLPETTLVDQYRVHVLIDIGDGAAQFTEMPHDPDKGAWIAEAGALLGRRLPVDDQGRVRPATLWCRAELQGPDGAIRLEERLDGVLIRSGAAERLDFRRTIFQEAIGEQTFLYRSGDDPGLGVFAVDAFGNVDLSFTADVELTFHEQKIRVKVVEGVGTVPALFFNCGEPENYTVSVVQRGGVVSGEIHLAVSPGGYFRRPRFLREGGGEFLTAPDEKSVEASLHGERTLKVYLQGEAWDQTMVPLQVILNPKP